MTDDSMLPDIVAAVIIVAGLFVGSLGILDAASGHTDDVSVHECQDRHQITTKEVLTCP